MIKYRNSPPQYVCLAAVCGERCSPRNYCVRISKCIRALVARKSNEMHLDSRNVIYGRRCITHAMRNGECYPKYNSSRLEWNFLTCNGWNLLFVCRVSFEFDFDHYYYLLLCEYGAWRRLLETILMNCVRVNFECVLIGTERVKLLLFIEVGRGLINLLIKFEYVQQLLRSSPYFARQQIEWVTV